MRATNIKRRPKPLIVIDLNKICHTLDLRNQNITELSEDIDRYQDLVKSRQHKDIKEVLKGWDSQVLGQIEEVSR